MLSEKSAFAQFNFSIFLHFIARGLYALFVPLILLKNNYPLNTVLWFLIFSALVVIISSYTAQKIFYHKRAIIFNIMAVIAEIVLMVAFSFKNFSLPVFILIFVCEGLYFGFYYFSYYSIINHYTSDKLTGKNVGNASIALNLAATVTPFVGAILLDQNPLYLISIAVFFLFLSLLPMLSLTKEDINGANLPILDIKTAKTEFFEYGLLAAIEIIIFALWAIYAFLNGVSLAIISTIAIASGLASILIAEKIKNAIAKPAVRKNLKFIAIILISLLSLHRYFYPEKILLSNLFFGIAFLILNLCVETELFLKIKGFQTYHSSSLISITAFTARIIIVFFALLIGLQNIILAPIFLSAIYLFITLRKAHPPSDFSAPHHATTSALRH